jgi:hypothetical protein
LCISLDCGVTSKEHTSRVEHYYGIEDYLVPDASTINNQVEPLDLLYLNFHLHCCLPCSPLISSKILLTTNIAVFTLLKANIIVHAICNRY